MLGLCTHHMILTLHIIIGPVTTHLYVILWYEDAANQPRKLCNQAKNVISLGHKIASYIERHV